VNLKVLIIADIHGNATALEAVLEKERDADRTVFLGDAVLPGPQPNETIALLNTISEGVCITGNHDTEMLHPEHFANFPPQWLAFYNWVIDNFDPSGFPFLQDLKPAGEYEVGGIRMCLHHGMVEGGPRHALPHSPDEDLLKLTNGSDALYVLFGHSHVQFSRTINGQQFINPGSIGQNRCGKQLACYGVFEDGVYRHCQLGYEQAPWLAAFDKIDTFEEFPDFRQWLRDGFVSGYANGESEPWTTFAAQGYS
jgi:putative phosphoesterase